MRYERVYRPGGLLSAVLIAGLTFAVAAHAVQTITTPNAFAQSYSLAAGASSAMFTVPSNTVTSITGFSTTTNNVGVGIVGLVSSSASNYFDYRGVTTCFGNNILPGYGSPGSTGGGGYPLNFDPDCCVNIEFTTLTSLVVNNTCSTTQTGGVTETW